MLSALPKKWNVVLLARDFVDEACIKPVPAFLSPFVKKYFESGKLRKEMPCRVFENIIFIAGCAATGIACCACPPYKTLAGGSLTCTFRTLLSNCELHYDMNCCN